jgi:hypothetical protein
VVADTTFRASAQDVTGQGLGATRTGTRWLGKQSMRTGRSGTGDAKEHEIVLGNVQEEVHLL